AAAAGNAGLILQVGGKLRSEIDGLLLAEGSIQKRTRQAALLVEESGEKVSRFEFRVAHARGDGLPGGDGFAGFVSEFLRIHWVMPLHNECRFALEDSECSFTGVCVWPAPAGSGQAGAGLSRSGSNRRERSVKLAGDRFFSGASRQRA